MNLKNLKTRTIYHIFLMPLFVLSIVIDAYSGEIGFVDINRILLESQDALDVKDLLKLEKERLTIRLEKKINLLKTRVDETLQGRYYAGDTVYKEYQQTLTEIRDDYQYIGSLIEFREVELSQGLLSKIIDAVKETAAKKGYRYVFDLTESKIVFPDTRDDLTGDVIGLMDKIHYEIRLLDDLKTKKRIYLWSDAERRLEKEIVEIDSMIALLDKRHRGDKKESAAAATAGAEAAIGGKAVRIEKPPAASVISAPILEKKEANAPDWQKELAEDKSSVEKKVKKEDVTEKDAKRINNFVEKWRRSWESKDIDEYMKCYSKRFKSKGMDWDAWKNYRASLDKIDSERKISVSGVRISREGGNIIVSFKQEYIGEGKSIVAIKTLHLEETDEDLKIVREGLKDIPGRKR